MLDSSAALLRRPIPAVRKVFPDPLKGFVSLEKLIVDPKLWLAVQRSRLLRLLETAGL